MRENNNFYVYTLLDPRKPGCYQYEGLNFTFLYEPFYVGKGKIYNNGGNRYLEHLREAKNTDKNTPKLNKIRKIMRETGQEPLILKLKEYLPEDKAFNLEKLVIRVVGRYDLGLGPLLNLTDGGEGSSGWFPNEEQREKASKSHKGKPAWNKNKKGKDSHMWGKKHTDEEIEKIRQANTGRILTEEQREKIGKIHRGRKLSEEHRRKISIATTGENNPMYGKRGKDNPNYGRKASEEERENKRLSQLGKHHTPETKERIGNKNRKENQSEETRIRKSNSHIGQIPWNKGKKTGPQSEETKKKQSESQKKRWEKRREMLNEDKCKNDDIQNI